MLNLNGVGKLGLRWGPTGLALGTRRLHYAWVIVAIASVMGMVSSSVQFAPKVLVLPSTARRLLANWEESLAPEARSSA